MTKAEFVEKYAEKTGMSKKDAAAAVNAFFEVTADALKAGDKIVFPGVFKAEVGERAARTGRNPQTGIARRYAEHWEEMQAENIGCLFWGNVGNGKSYLAGCIANALMEKEVPVYMTNFAVILGDLSPGFTGRNEYISRLCRYPLLIIDDFGMERGTDYGLEQVFHVIDTRYRSNKPLIATTNRPLDELKKPTDTAHSRIYDRLLSMCVPIRFTGVNFRQETAKRKMETMKKLLAE